MKLSYFEKKYYTIETHNGVEYGIIRDGQVIMFNRADIEPILNKHYPQGFNGGKVWYFNNTKDREIAELRGSRVYANPQVLWRHKDELISAVEPPKPLGISGIGSNGNVDRAITSDPHDSKS